MAARSKKPLALDAILEEAKEALNTSENEKASTLLVRAWAIAPHPRIAALCELVTQRVATSPPRGATVTEREANWLAAAESGDQNAVPSLMAYDWPVYPREAKARLKALSNLAPDPRIVQSLFNLRKSGRYTSNSGYVFWRMVWKLLAKWRYPGLREVFADVKEGDIEWYGLESLINAYKAPEPVILPHNVDALLASMEEGHATGKTRDGNKKRALLLDAVYEDPTDDGPRLVLADFLTEEGDERGEFIQLDIQHAREKNLKKSVDDRRRALGRKGGRRWMEGLDPQIGHVEFIRGFAGEASIPDSLDPEHRGHRTIEILKFLDSPPAKLLLHPNLAFVQQIHNITAKTLSGLAEKSEGRFISFISTDQIEGENKFTAKTCGLSIGVLDTDLGVAKAIVAMKEPMPVKELHLRLPMSAFSEVAALASQLPESFERIVVDGFLSGVGYIIAKPFTTVQIAKLGSAELTMLKKALPKGWTIVNL